MKPFRALALAVAVVLVACSHGEKSAQTSANSLAASASCAGNNAGLTLPHGFCATIFADSLGHVRHLAVSGNGDVYVNTWKVDDDPKDHGSNAPYLVALRDTNRDGKADVIARFGDSLASGGTGGTGIALYHGALYAEAQDKILRFTVGSDLAPRDAPTTVVSGLPLTGNHAMHPFAIDSAGNLYVDLGSATNSCQVKDRTLHSPGITPCTELATRGGIWRYDANKTGQHFSSAERYATGIRNAVGIAIDPHGQLFSTQHGRDQLSENWPQLYTAQQGADLPAEELLKIQKDGNYGWPTCYFDSTQKKLVLAPEYGGDGGRKVGVCASRIEPAAYFPAHWAPDDLAFYDGAQFPQEYRGGAFIAFHGSWNRAPLPQEGYRVVFVPFVGGSPRGAWQTFANGFAGSGQPQPSTAAHRPAGLAVGADGSLYIGDDVAGRVWRVVYKGAAK